MPAQPAAAAGGRDAAAFIAVRGLDVAYRPASGSPVLALRGLEIAVREQEFVAVVGPSGCGKSTLLNVLAGLIAPSAGVALVAGKPAGHPRDDIGLVFQAPTLLPWFSILDNVLLPMRVQRRPGRRQWDARAMQLLDMVGLRDFARRYPGELSGGMQQRVGMARALMHDPALLLMDEPFGALDALTRESMNQELQRIWMAQPKTVVFVTHSIAEAVFLADRVLVMSDRPGRLLADIAVPLPRPREMEMVDGAAFGAIAHEVRQHLHRRATPRQGGLE